MKNYKAICIEDLNIQGMMKGSKNAKNYLDCSWSNFVNLLEKKSENYDCQISKISRWYPSSQTCHNCGYKFPLVAKKHLEIWKCPDCGKVHQRDENAALNIKAEGLKVLWEAEEKSKKSNSKNCLPKGTTSPQLTVSQLAELALSFV